MSEGMSTKGRGNGSISSSGSGEQGKNKDKNKNKDKDRGESKGSYSSRGDLMVVDATGHIAGRLCSYVAKMLLNDSRVVIVNAEKAFISGRRESVIEEWHRFLEVSSVVHPKHGPFHPRRPDNIIRRMVRGMLPRKRPKGIQAMKRLRVYIGVPEEYVSAEFKVFEDAKIRKPESSYISIYDLARSIGWSP
ncbi:MAG: 50S ribosomal protein L13 [Candidatus Nitrosocaldus sp.]|nr:50S ribosomal protein L13 [Candidatus Nitrosocaldus sp.]